MVAGGISRLGSVGGGEAACAKRESQVAAAFSDMEHTIGRLPELLERLEGRLGAVLRAPAPVDESNKTAGRPMCVPLVESLDRHINIVQMANNRLEDILERLEL